MTAGGDLNAAATAVSRYPEPAVRQAVASIRGALAPRLKVDTGGDSRLSGIGNARLPIVTKVTAGASLAEGRVATARRGTFGPWRWLNDGVRPYTTAAGNRHPGTRPKRTWDDPVDQVMPTVETDLVRGFDRIV